MDKNPSEINRYADFAMFYYPIVSALHVNFGFLLFISIQNASNMKYILQTHIINTCIILIPIPIAYRNPDNVPIPFPDPSL